MLRCDIGSGRAYVFGWRLRPLLELPGVARTCSESPRLFYLDSHIRGNDKDGDVFTFPIGSTGMLSTSQTPASLGSLNPGQVIASPAVNQGTTGTAVNTIYLPSENGMFFILQQASNGGVSVSSSVTVDSTSAYCSPLGNCALDSAPASITDILLFGGGEKNFYAFDDAGTQLFAFATNGYVASGAATSRSRAYFGSFEGYIYCLCVNGQ
jgi:outer membrane protein assembly factor BamB